VAEHKGRTVAATNGAQAIGDSRHAASARAAQAAARVAARYAKAPSYSEMLADEARAAVRAAEAASKAALEAQAAAESVLAGLEAASSPTPAWEADFFTAAVAEPARPPAVEPAGTAAPAAQLSIPSSPQPCFEIRWDADLPVRASRAGVARASRGTAVFATPGENSRQSATLSTEGVEVVEAAQPIHANLIQFPRELVATRKIRPRRAEGPYAASMEAQGQLSIFEVEPWSISTEPAASGAAAEAGTAAWVGPKWSGIELDEETPDEMASPAAEPARMQREEPAVVAAAMQPAPMNQRLMAAVVDFSLVTGVFLAGAVAASANASVLPAIWEVEFGSGVALALLGALYLAFFLMLAGATPGMKYAHLEMRTFAGKRPNVAQRCGRMAAIVLSLLPLGLGAAMAIFDEQQLSWHDRLSGTYLRGGWGLGIRD
jgi:uncharacterized RDD family membrane protein YckC